jgi:hypothetical protein
LVAIRPKVRTIKSKRRPGGGDGILPKRGIRRILSAIDHIERFRDVREFMALATGLTV